MICLLYFEAEALITDSAEHFRCVIYHEYEVVLIVDIYPKDYPSSLLN